MCRKIGLKVYQLDMKNYMVKDKETEKYFFQVSKIVKDQCFPILKYINLVKNPYLIERNEKQIEIMEEREQEEEFKQEDENVIETEPNIGNNILNYAFRDNSN